MPKTRYSVAQLVTTMAAGIAAALLMYYVALGQVPQYRAMIVGVLSAIVAMMAVMGAFTARNAHRDERDIARTCDPLMERYRGNHDPEALRRDFVAWQEGEHSSNVRIIFVQKVVDSLIADRHYEQARGVLEDFDASKIISADTKEYERFVGVSQTMVAQAVSRDEANERLRKSKGYRRRHNRR